MGHKFKKIRKPSTVGRELYLFLLCYGENKFTYKYTLLILCKHLQIEPTPTLLDCWHLISLNNGKMNQKTKCYNHNNTRLFSDDGITLASLLKEFSLGPHMWISPSPFQGTPAYQGISGRNVAEKKRKKKKKELCLANLQESGVILENDYQTRIHYSTGQSGRAQSPYLYHKSDLSVLITLKSPSHTPAILGGYYTL